MVVRKWLMIGSLIVAFSLPVSLVITSALDRMEWEKSGYVPEPPPKPTMTVTLRMDEFAKRWMIEIPTEREPLWEEFTIDPTILKPDTDGLVKCRIVFEYDEK
jgi:hypothetical protein